MSALNTSVLGVFLPDYVHISVVLVRNLEEELGLYGKKILKCMSHE
jgi:hypothetical protein